MFVRLFILILFGWWKVGSKNICNEKKKHFKTKRKSIFSYVFSLGHVANSTTLLAFYNKLFKVYKVLTFFSMIASNKMKIET